ncbi:hypothetical protein NQ318_010887 [Aromia moschata]|uniref:Mutator-like transposase domain-containing protein n=1 Tax=Aromia moschata TaxID=1265417 RepID=A0AAV8XKZ4_9CUCU|nr:hypothetical protein NQ318_010887 [Aromia moschata]
MQKDYRLWQTELVTTVPALEKSHAGKMEVDSAKEVFQRSEEKHNVKYSQYIGDGNSKTSKATLDLDPYNNDPKVMKKERVGHVEKNAWEPSSVMRRKQTRDSREEMNSVVENSRAASVARAWSGYLDSLFGQVISNTTITITGEMHEQLLGRYPDFLAFAVCIVYALLLGIGVKGSAIVNSILTLVNLAVMVLVIVVGFYYADETNWTTQKGEYLLSVNVLLVI